MSELFFRFRFLIKAIPDHFSHSAHHLLLVYYMFPYLEVNQESSSREILVVSGCPKTPHSHVNEGEKSRTVQHPLCPIDCSHQCLSYSVRYTCIPFRSSYSLVLTILYQLKGNQTLHQRKKGEGGSRHIYF